MQISAPHEHKDGTASTGEIGGALLLSQEQERRILSSARVKIALTTFVGALMLAFGLLTIVLVSHIFGQLNPPLRRDLEWKAERGAAEIAVAAQYGMLLADADLIRKALDRYTTDRDVAAIVVADASGHLLTEYATSPLSTERLFSGPPDAVRAEDTYLVAWAESVVEGKPVGRVAFVASTERLAGGALLEHRIMATLAAGCLTGLLLSLSFVAFYVSPLIRVTERAFARLRQAGIDLAAKERLEKELEIGARIQTCLVPKQFQIAGLEIAARMKPATEVGGDYYDFIPTDDGCWIGVGDVAGHGFTSGLVMLMAQSAIAGLVVERPQATASEIVRGANRVLYENIRHRLDQDQHLTLSLLRYFRDGRLIFAGAHEDMIVYRQRTRQCELVPTQGTWLGAVEDISHATEDRGLQLEEGDTLVLYTDGVTEAMNAKREQYGIDRLVRSVEDNAEQSVADLLETVLGRLDNWMATQDDDVTVVVVRYRAARA